MTAGDSLNETLREIIDLLQECGREEKAEWLQQRKAILQDATTTEDEREVTVAELHQIVLGMGGLMDLSLSPGSSSTFSGEIAREKLDTLSDRLYELTR